jgi:hypothetical protein
MTNIGSSTGPKGWGTGTLISVWLCEVEINLDSRFRGNDIIRGSGKIGSRTVLLQWPVRKADRPHRAGRFPLHGRVVWFAMGGLRRLVKDGTRND